jgi:Sec-independent protein translocase protein TatA
MLGMAVGPELLLLLVALIVILVWRGPSTLPRLGESLGKAVKSARHALQRDHDDDDQPVDDPTPGAKP